MLWVDQLDPADKDKIKKMSEETVKKHLQKEGWKAEELAAVPLTQLKEALAQAWVQQREAELHAAVGGRDEVTDTPEQTDDVDVVESVEIVRMQLEVEREKIALEREKVNMEKMKFEAELSFRQQELSELCALKRGKLKLMEEKNEAERKRTESAVFKAKLFSDALRGTMVRMPSDPIEMIPYFRTVEKLFADFKVEPELKVHLLKPHLTEQARILLARMDPAKCGDYEAVKTLLLHEFKLSPAALLEKFNVLQRQPQETCTLFGNRLMSVLTYYVTSRNAKSHDELMQLLVCDRIKSTLSQATLQYILSLENNTENGWLKLPELVEAIDVYYDTHLSTDKPRIVQSAVRPLAGFPPKSFPPNTSHMRTGYGQTRNFNDPHTPPVNNSSKRCYVCGSANHLASFHGKRNPNRTSISASGNDASHDGRARSVNACATANADQQLHLETQVKTLVSQPELNTEASVDINRVAVSCDIDLTHNTDISVSDCDVIECQQSVDEPDSTLNVCSHFAALSYLPVVVSDDDGNQCSLNGLSDSGAEVALANSSAVADLNPVDIGSVTIKGVIGEPISVPLVRLKVAPADRLEHTVSFACAVTDQANSALILTADIIRKLMPKAEHQSQCTAVWHSVDEDVHEVASVCDIVDTDAGSSKDDAINDVDVVYQTSPSVSDMPDEIDSTAEEVCPKTSSVTDVPSNAEAAVLKWEQLADQTLTGCFSLAKRDKGRFYFKNGVLHRLDLIVGQAVEQLVLPESRRQQAIDLAHQTFGAHMGYKSTAKRLRYSFWWPTMARDTKASVSRCDRCVRRARITCYDRVPIKNVDRGATPFNHWWCDVAGPLFPNQRVEYNYCFVACDGFSRWPIAMPLRSVNAKSICDCLMKIWMTFGISQFVSMDNASYNTAKLTEILLEKMGCSPIFITPGHSEGNTLAERTIGTIKESIHKVAFDHQKSWHKYLDYILWAMREIPSSSSGVSPWQLAFGYAPRGPGAILKDTWMGERALPPKVDRPIVQYLQELRDKLVAADKYATAHLEREQSRWTHRYNLRSRHKEFFPGESVMVLTPDSTASRLWSRWRAPAKIIRKQGDYSYLVEIDGSRQLIHANKLRKYDVKVNEIVCNMPQVPEEITGVNTCAVVYEKDKDFGPLKYVETKTVTSDLPSTKIDPSKLAHLSEQQRTEFLAVLDKYPECFSETPGYCDSVEHEIIVTPEFRPKRMKAYRVPEKLRPAVDKQIKELEELGFIKESKSPMVSPLVCVIKKDKTVRCVIDFRFVNKYTVPDALGPPNMADVSQRIARAKYITTFDGKSSYWTIPIKKEHQWLTGFIDGSNRMWEWTRMAFGLRNSGSTFVRMLQNVLHPIRDFAANYVDDMAVCSDEWKQHLSHIDQFLTIIKQSGLTLTLKKSECAKAEVKFGGSILGSGGKRVDPDKLATIKLLKRPETKTELRQVLGLFGWFREYIPGFAEHALPLTKLTAKLTPSRIPWGDVEQKAFNTLKELLSRATEYKLNAIDWNKPFNVCTDASELAIAGVLSQTDDKGHEQPITFFSKKLDSTQQKWSTVEREAFAVIEMLNRVRVWVFGYKIYLFSDHNPLSYLRDSASKSAKLMRWGLALQEYDITFHYKEGKSNMMAVPDCLSRIGQNFQQ